MSGIPTIGELLFGEKSDEVHELFLKEDISSAEARKVLEAIKHTEIHFVYDYLRWLIEEMDTEHPAYSSIFPPFAKEYAGGAKEPEKVLLFTDFSYQNGLVQKFCKLLEKAFPGYEVPSTQPIGEILMKKRYEKPAS